MKQLDPIMDNETFCPSSMCPLFAAQGSPWTGDYDIPCLKEKCGFYFQGHCDAASGSEHQVNEAEMGLIPLQIGKTFYSFS